MPLTTAIQRAALARAIAARVRGLADAGDELLALDRMLDRLELGLQRHGALDLARPHDWRRERFEERLDALVYDVFDELVLEDAARAELREAARREILGELEFDGSEQTVASNRSAEIALDDIDDRGVRGAEVDMEWDESDVEHGGEGG